MNMLALTRNWEDPECSHTHTYVVYFDQRLGAALKVKF